ncbi:hypothetical protein BXZ70DRAFT_1076341 [Cristinia sonorae]|uniref:Uncharacterized protein n=1 Tax=Cristinia sonorae TaxID=1940300 RepID=A0A8K0XS04_9AGAR|nr:hypothetical protein BXZ70DRAFT_1076341 [Cristinia sonorae]
MSQTKTLSRRFDWYDASNPMEIPHIPYCHLPCSASLHLWDCLGSHQGNVLRCKTPALIVDSLVVQDAQELPFIVHLTCTIVQSDSTRRWTKFGSSRDSQTLSPTAVLHILGMFKRDLPTPGTTRPESPAPSGSPESGAMQSDRMPSLSEINKQLLTAKDDNNKTFEQSRRQQRIALLKAITGRDEREDERHRDFSQLMVKIGSTYLSNRSAREDASDSAEKRRTALFDVQEKVRISSFERDQASRDHTVEKSRKQHWSLVKQLEGWRRQRLLDDGRFRRVLRLKERRGSTMLREQEAAFAKAQDKRQKEFDDGLETKKETMIIQDIENGRSFSLAQKAYREAARTWELEFLTAFTKQETDRMKVFMEAERTRERKFLQATEENKSEFKTTLSSCESRFYKLVRELERKAYEHEKMRMKNVFNWGLVKRREVKSTVEMWKKRMAAAEETRQQAYIELITPVNSRR